HGGPRAGGCLRQRGRLRLPFRHRDAGLRGDGGDGLRGAGRRRQGRRDPGRHRGRRKRAHVHAAGPGRPDEEGQAAAERRRATVTVGEASPPRHGTALVAGGDRRVAGALRERDPRAPPLRPAEQVLASGYSRGSRRSSWRQTSGESARPELVGPNLGTITGPSPVSTTTTSVPNVSLSSSARNTSV